MSFHLKFQKCFHFLLVRRIGLLIFFTLVLEKHFSFLPKLNIKVKHARRSKTLKCLNSTTILSVLFFYMLVLPFECFLIYKVLYDKDCEKYIMYTTKSAAIYLTYVSLFCVYLRCRACHVPR